MAVRQVKDTADFLKAMSTQVQSAALTRGQTAPRVVSVQEGGSTRRWRITPSPFGNRAKVEEMP